MLLPSQLIDINKSLNYKSNSTSPSSNTSSTTLSSSSPSIPNSPSCIVTASSASMNTFNYNNEYDEDNKINKHNQNDQNYIQSNYYNTANSSKYCLPIRSNLFRFHPYQKQQNNHQQHHQQVLEYEQFNNNNIDSQNNNNNEFNILNQQQSSILCSAQQQPHNYSFDTTNSATEVYANSNLYLQPYANFQQSQSQQYYTLNDNKIFNHLKNYNLQHHQIQPQQSNIHNTLYFIDYLNGNNINSSESEIASASYNENLINSFQQQQQNHHIDYIDDKDDEIIKYEHNSRRLASSTKRDHANNLKTNKSKTSIKNSTIESSKISNKNKNYEAKMMMAEVIKKETVQNLESDMMNTVGGPKKRVSANKKERRRTQSINTAFSDLRNRIPHVPIDTKLSKIKTLKLATKYIEYLMDVLEQNDPVLLSNGFKPDLGKLRKESRSKEIKLEVERKAKCRTGWPQDVWATELKNNNH